MEKNFTVYVTTIEQFNRVLQDISNSEDVPIEDYYFMHESNRPLKNFYIGYTPGGSWFYNDTPYPNLDATPLITYEQYLARNIDIYALNN